MSIDDKIPRPLLDYFARVGAEPVNFRRAIVRLRSGHYHYDKVSIKVASDGTVSSKDESLLPTREEQAAIAEAFARGEFPRHAAASEADLKALLKKLGGSEGTFAFYSRASGLVVMAQQRVETDAGKKMYVPWTYWDNGEWHPMEPEGDLPLWKPRERRNKLRIMLHEGAKAAEFADRLVNDPSMREQLEAHPYKDELAKYEHWGWIGGARNPHRTDWSELRREGPKLVVMSSDHDFLGESAIQLVSKLYGGRMHAIRWTDAFPQGFDLADPIPARLFNKAGLYSGPSLYEMTSPATFATEVCHTGERGRPAVILRSSFAEDWLHSIKPEVYVHRDWPQDVYTMQEFNNKVRPFSDTDDTARLLRAAEASKNAILQYSPANPPGIYTDDAGNRYINTFRPTLVGPARGDPSPFLEFVDYLVPDPLEAMQLLRWCATLIARPDVRMIWGLLLISETQGVGKGTLGEKILAPLVGTHNCSFPSEQDIVDGSFNYWACEKRLAVCHEIYAGQSKRAYNKLKSIVTDKKVTRKKKYQGDYEIDNWIHVFACSNSTKALRLEDSDRRWFVPRVTEEPWPKRKCVEFYSWLNEEGGLSIIHQWAIDYLAKDARGVSQARAVGEWETAPRTERKREVVEDNRSDGQKLVVAVLGQIEDPDAFVIDEHLRQRIKEDIHGGRQSEYLESAATIRNTARSVGWMTGKRVKTSQWGVKDCYILSRSERVLAANPTDLAKSGSRARSRC